ncbi:hypothetical protein SFRURICE_007364 [Spodoptera frugiperda]|nr:hypothetical protein SFRURICE_007364 [Spodoptera frugiperda]
MWSEKDWDAASFFSLMGQARHNPPTQLQLLCLLTKEKAGRVRERISLRPSPRERYSGRRSYATICGHRKCGSADGKLPLLTAARQEPDPCVRRVAFRARLK